MAYELTIRHVDTCLSCYVQNHCNGDDELLLGVSVDKSSRYYHVKDQLIAESRNGSSALDKIPDDISSDQIRLAIDELFSTAHPLKSFDSSLDRASDDNYVSCYAWFRVSWAPAEATSEDQI